MNSETNAMFPDTVAQLKDGWAVRYNGCIEGARWQDKCAAELHLTQLQEGKRKPQPELREDARRMTDMPVTILSTISKSTVEFGPRWLTVARRDDDGTQVVWFSVKAQTQPNERWLVSGRIKKAGQHDGVAQVELTRVALRRGAL